MDESLGPTLMVEPGSARTCVVAKADVEAFRARGYRLLEESAGEPEPVEQAEPEVPPEPAPAVDVSPFVQPDRPRVTRRRRRA